MKKYLSVFMLAARGAIYKLMALIAAMAVLEPALFVLYLRLRGTDAGLESAVWNSFVPVVFLLAYGALIIALYLWGVDRKGSHLGYTLGRLQIGERAAALCFALCNTVCLLIMWAAQTGIALLLCQIYLRQADPATVSGQTVLLAFYRSRFLHNLLPLADSARYLGNLLTAAALGLVLAVEPYRQRRGRKANALVYFAVIVAANSFNIGLAANMNSVIQIIASAIITVVALCMLWLGEKGERDEKIS